MSESARMWVEIIFNISYLVVVWGLVGVMLRRRGGLSQRNQHQADRVLWAFALLALGDSGHVGLRVWAYALGGLESAIHIAGLQLGLVGVGTFMTSVTVSLFYILMLDWQRVRFNRRYGWFEYLLLAAGLTRLFLLLFPANDWNSITPPQPWSTIRNLPLLVLGLGVVFLMLRDASPAKDRTLQWVAGMILVSFACYMPVILFVQQVPLLGMLMIPKTLAYVAIGFLAYFDLYETPKTVANPALKAEAD